MALRRMEHVQAIEVYIGERGYVCIKQEDPLGDTEDVVAMLPQQIPAIIQWLTECAAEVEGRRRAELGAAARLGVSGQPADVASSSF